MKAGLGKTFVAAGVIAGLSKRTLYIVPKKPLAVQARDDLIGCFGGNTMIGLYSKKQNHSNNVITIIVINSALKQPKEFFDSYALCIMDEIHMYCSEKRRIIFKKTCLPYVLGMSATTNNRKDLLDPCFQKEVACGGIVHADQLPGWEHTDVVFNTQVDICQYYGPDEYTKTLKHESTDVIFTPYMHKQFIQDPYRMRFAVDEIGKLYNEGHNIYVFAEERDMLDTLRQHMVTLIDAIAIEEDTGKFIGGINNTAIKDVSTKRIILTTYGYSSTGVSIDKQTAIVFLTSRRANMLQILARILRRGGDQTIQRRIIDIVDIRTPLRWQLTDRQIAYDYYNMDCRTRSINYNKITL
jgi:superfamily II DNA or RNA helicase